MNDKNHILARESIIALKRMKKTKKLGEVDIRSKIRKISMLEEC